MSVLWFASSFPFPLDYWKHELHYNCSAEFYCNILFNAQVDMWGI